MTDSLPLLSRLTLRLTRLLRRPAFRLTTLPLDRGGALTAVLLGATLLLAGFEGRAQSLVTYAGNAGNERFNDVLELSNGKVLVAGQADNLAWLPAGTPVSTLSVTLAPSQTSILSSSPQVAFLMLLSTNHTTIEGVWRFPAGSVPDVSRIRTTTRPGQPTGTIFISGQRNYTIDSRLDGYYLARLDNNFVSGNPTGVSWYYSAQARPRGASPSAYKTIQPWDVGGDGNIVFGIGTDYDTDWAAIHKLNGATGTLMVVNDWPAHWGNGGWTAPGVGQAPASFEWNGTPASSAPATVTVRRKSTPLTSPPDSTINFTVAFSGIGLKTGRAGTLRSTTLADYLYDGLDENRNPRKGKFPDDFFFNGPLNGPPGFEGTGRGRLTDGVNYGPQGSGYFVPRPTVRLGAITIDRRDNHIYYGYSTQSRLPSGLPDFEPTIVSMTNTGQMKWWARLYDQRRFSEPDQYIDAMEIDYAGDMVAVMARQHGAGVNVFFRGGTLFYNPGGISFQNSMTGINTVQTGHFTWLGKYRLLSNNAPYPVFPELRHVTYVGEYTDQPSGLGPPSNDPQLDRWPIPSSGFPDLNTTRGLTRMAVTRAGGVAIAATGRRTITTVDAFQKMPKPGTGSVSTWNDFIRVYRPDLSSVIYSSLLTGAWDTLSGQGGSNVKINGFWPFDNGVFVVGHHQADALSGASLGVPMPTASVPAWGRPTPQGQEAVFGRLGFVNQAPVAINQTQQAFCTSAPNNTYSISITPPPTFLVSFNPGNQFVVEISNAAGRFAEQGGTTTPVGSINSTSNGVQTVPITLTGFAPGTGYGMRVRGTNPVTTGFWYATQIVSTVPTQPQPIEGPLQICANSAGSTTYRTRPVGGATTYEWRLTPTQNPSPPPFCNGDPSCAGVVSVSDTAATVVWNPSYSGSATLEVRAVNPCGTSAWRTLSIPQIAPCITTAGTFDLCAGESLPVTFTVPAGVNTAGTNSFTVELSDAAGAFPGTDIGTFNNLAGGVGPITRTVTATLPAAAASSAGYRLRVRGVTGITPSVLAAPTVMPSRVRNRPQVPEAPTGSLNLCANGLAASYVYTVAAVPNVVSYEYRITPDSAGAITSIQDNNVTIVWANIIGTPTIEARAVNECGASTWGPATSINIANCAAVTAVNPSAVVCPGQSGVTVSFTTPAGQSYTSGNSFTAEIIDQSGTVVGTLGSVSLSNATPFPAITGTTGAGVIPRSLTPGQYLVRIRSSAHPTVRIGGGFALTVTSGAPARPGVITPSTTTPACGGTVTFTVPAVPGADGYNWSINPGTAGTFTTNSGLTATLQLRSFYLPTGQVTVLVKAFNSCDSSEASTLVLTWPNSGACASPGPPQGTTPVNGDFRTANSGPWNYFGTWESRTGGAWAPATAVPNSASGVITIRAGHTVTLGYPILAGTGTSFSSPVGAGVDLTGVTNSSNQSWNTAVVSSDGRAWRSVGTQGQGGGQTWSAVTLSGGAVTRFNGVNAYSSGRYAIAVGNGGSIKFGDDGANNGMGGATWSDAIVGGDGATTQNLRAVDINTSAGGIVGDNGTVITLSGTTTFTNVTSSFNDASAQLRSALMSSATGPLHVVGAGGYYRSTSNWSATPTWNAAQTIGGGANLNDIAQGATTSLLIAVGDGGVILRSTNGGGSWVQIMTGLTTANLRSVRGNSTSNDVFIVGDGGIIIHSYDFNAGSPTGFILPDITAQNLLDIFPANSTDRVGGHIVGANGTLIADLSATGFNNTMDQVVIEQLGTLRAGTKQINYNINGVGYEMDVAGVLDYTVINRGQEYGQNSQSIALRSTGLWRHGRHINQGPYQIFGRKDNRTGLTFDLEPGSTVELYHNPGESAFSVPSGGLPIYYHNITWNGFAQSTGVITSLRFLPRQIGGTFTVLSTNNQDLSLNNEGPAQDIYYSMAGGIRVEGGRFFLTSNNASNPVIRMRVDAGAVTVTGGELHLNRDRGLSTINTGSYTQTGGLFDLGRSSTTNLKGGSMTVTGNFNQTAGILSQFQASNAAIGQTQGQIILSGTALQNVRALGSVEGFLTFALQNSGPGFQLTGAFNGADIEVNHVSGNINLGSHIWQAGTYTLRGVGTPFATLSSSGGQMRVGTLALVTGILDNTADALTITSGALTPISGAGRLSHVRGNLRKALAANVEGNYLMPLGTAAGYRPLRLDGLRNDGSAKVIGASVSQTGANQAAGVNIQNVGSQPGVGGQNWRLRTVEGAGSLAQLSSVVAIGAGFTDAMRFGLSSTGLTSGFASIGADLTPSPLGTVSQPLFEMGSNKPINLPAIGTTSGIWLAIGGPVIVAPPGGGYTIGPGGDFATLTAVAAHYNDVTFSSPATFTFTSTYNGAADNGGAEVFPIIFRQNQTQPVTIRYQGTTPIETSSSIANPVQNALVIFDGADRITFQGNDQWRFLNKGKCQGCAAFRLQNDATRNTLRDLIIEGSSPLSTFNGVVHFGSSLKPEGNSLNKIESSTIGSNSERRRGPQLTAIANNSFPGLPPGVVVWATNTNPITISTAGPHGLNSGDRIFITGVQGNRAANGYWPVTVTGAQTFTIPTAGSGDFTTMASGALQIASVSGSTPAVVTTTTPHHFRTRMQVVIRNTGTVDNGNSNEFSFIDSLSPTTFALYADAALTQARGGGAASSGQVHNPQRSGTITLKVTNVTNTSPIQVTLSAPHRLTTGEAVWLERVQGNTAANGIWLITRINDYTFSLQGSLGNGTYTGGGYFTVPPLVVTATAHGLTTGQQMSITGVAGVTTANGSPYVRVLNGNTFALFSDATLRQAVPITNPLSGSLAGAVLTRPGLPVSLTFNSVVVSGGVATIRINQVFGPEMLGRTFGVVINGVGGITSINNNRHMGTVISTGSGNSLFTIPSTASGTYTSGGTGNTNSTLSQIDNLYQTGAPHNSYFNPLVWPNNSAPGHGIVPGDVVTISGVTGLPTLNGTFMVWSMPYNRLVLGAWTNPTPSNPQFGANPNFPFNGQISAARDSLVGRLVVSSNTGTSLNSNNEFINNAIYSFDQVGVDVTAAGNGGGWRFVGNSFYNLPAQPPTISNPRALNFIPGSKSNNNLIQGNFFGGTAPEAQGGPMTFQASGSVFPNITMIALNAGQVIPTIVEGNLMRNINSNLITTSGTGLITALHHLGGSAKIRDNIIGGLTSENLVDTMVSNTQMSPNLTMFVLESSGEAILERNLIQRIRPAGGLSAFRINGPGRVVIRNNDVRQIKGGSGSIVRFVWVQNGAGTDITVDSNRIYNVEANIHGFDVEGTNSGGIITRNRLFANLSGAIKGIVIRASTTAPQGWLVANNQLTIPFTPRQSAGAQGIELNLPAGGTAPRIFFNSVYLGSTYTQPPGAASITASFVKSGVGMGEVRNNLFYNVFSVTGGSTVPAYAAYVANTTGWVGSQFSHNILFTNGAQSFMGYYGPYSSGTAITDIAQWNSITMSPANLYASATFKVDQPAANGDLALSAENCPIKDKGVSVNYFADFDSLNIRDLGRPDIGSNEFSKQIPTGAFWIGLVSSDWNTDANWCDNRVPLETEDVVISNAPTRAFMPVVSEPSATCRNLTMVDNPGSMLVIYGHQAALTLTGKTPLLRFGNGNISHVSGRLVFDSDSSQNIPAPAVAETYANRNTALLVRQVATVTYTNSPDIATITTTTAHGLVIGDQVELRGIGGLANMNRQHKVFEVVSTTVFRVRAFTGGTYEAGSGRVIPLAAIPIASVTGLNVSPIMITTRRAHNLSVGQFVTLTGIKNNTAANGAFEVAAVTPTTLTIVGTGTGNYTPDTNAYVLPARTGYFDFIARGQGVKMADGVFQAASLSVEEGFLRLPFGTSVIRDSVFVGPAGTLNVQGTGLTTRSISNLGGFMTVLGATSAPDSIRTTGGATTFLGDVSTGRLVSIGGSTTLQAGITTITDSLTARGGQVVFNGTSASAKIVRLSGTGTITHGMSGNLSVTDSLLMSGGDLVMSAGGSVNVARSLNLRSGLVRRTAGTGSLVMTNVAGGPVFGGSPSSYVEAPMQQTSNTVHGGVSFTISGSTSAGSPIVVTHSGHNLQTGEVVLVSGVTANPSANGVWRVTRLSATQFELQSTEGTALSSAGQGTVRRMQVRRFPVGENGFYRPATLFLTQNAAVSTGYVVMATNSAPPTLTLPTGVPRYPDGQPEDVLGVVPVNYLEVTSTGTNLEAGSLMMTYGTPEGITRHGRRATTILKSNGPSAWEHLWGFSEDSVAPLRMIRTVKPFTGFSFFAIGQLEVAPLPVTLERFEGVRKGADAQLSWVVAGERDLSHYTLERSRDGVTFEAIARVTPKGASGARTRYAYVDAGAFGPGLMRAYYRLRPTDLDGSSHLSQTILLQAQGLEAERQLSAYPVPFGRSVTLRLPDQLGQGAYVITLTDLTGRQIGQWTRTRQPGEAEATLEELESLPAGAYHLQVKGAGFSGRLMINHL